MTDKTEFTFNFDDADMPVHFEDTDTEVEVESKVPSEVEVEEVDPEAEEEHPEHEEFLAIFDAMMFEDKFEKTYKLGRKYTCVISTRSADSDLRIARQIDGMNFKTMHALQSLSALLTLSHSLVELNGKDLREMKPSTRYEFITSKSSHLIEMLSRHMVDFDSLVRESLSYGELNF